MIVITHNDEDGCPQIVIIQMNALKAYVFENKLVQAIT